MQLFVVFLSGWIVRVPITTKGVMNPVGRTVFGGKPTVLPGTPALE